MKYWEINNIFVNTGCFIVYNWANTLPYNYSLALLVLFSTFDSEFYKELLSLNLC